MSAETPMYVCKQCGYYEHTDIHQGLCAQLSRAFSRLAEVSAQLELAKLAYGKLFNENAALQGQFDQASESRDVQIDNELYQAYLLGCEDECVPEPRTREQFLKLWADGE